VDESRTYAVLRLHSFFTKRRLFTLTYRVTQSQQECSGFGCSALESANFPPARALPNKFRAPTGERIEQHLEEGSVNAKLQGTQRVFRIST
jgi:hypothetical protein